MSDLARGLIVCALIAGAALALRYEPTDEASS
jgi:hypothetical protein